MARGLFATYHPAVSMLYFALAIVFTFSTTQPAYVAISCVMASAYLLFLRGARSFVRATAAGLPAVLLIGLLNSLFNTAGATKLWRWGPFCMTLEGVYFSLAVGGMLVAALLWFACYDTVMTEDRFVYLFGRALPTLSLLVTVVSRWVPRMARRGRAVHEAQEALVGADDPSAAGRLRRSVRLATVLAGLGMEDSIQMADSMTARGFGSARRTSYARFRWHAREVVALAVLAGLGVANAVFLANSLASFAYYPRVTPIVFSVGYLTQALMMGLPLLVEVEALAKRVIR